MAEKPKCEQCGTNTARKNYKGRQLCIGCATAAEQADKRKVPPSQGGRTFKRL